MPEGKDNDLAREYVIVDVVANAIKLEAAKVGILVRCAALSNAWLQCQEPCCRLKVVGDGAGCRWSIGGPPLRSSLKLSQCLRRDFDRKHDG